MTLQESVEAVRWKYPQHRKPSYDYIPCPTRCDGFLIRYAYDNAWCPSCGYREAYLD